MSYFPAYIYIGLALLALLFVNQTTANKPRGNVSKTAPTTWPHNCYTLYFSAGPTKRIETLLIKMNKTLSQVESDIKTLKGTCNTVKGNETCKPLANAAWGFFYSPSQLIAQAILRQTAVIARQPYN